jgi:hypothetical protein
MKLGAFPPFVVAIFSGYSKPNNLDEYLEDFVNEMLALQHDNILYRDKLFTVTLWCFVCDAPARCFMKQTIGCNGYNACERCKAPGMYHRQRRMMYHPVGLLYAPRTGAEFAHMHYRGGHQTGRTCLIDLGVDCVTQFSLDYMHMVCLGVVKRILTFMTKAQVQFQCRLPARDIACISENLCKLAGKLSREFSRQPWSLGGSRPMEGNQISDFSSVHRSIGVEGHCDR